MDKIEKNKPIMQLGDSDSGALYVPYCDITSSKDITEEFSLADYFPEVRRIISVSADVIPEGKFISGDTVECDGTVSFIVTYLGEDKTIAAAPFNVQYSLPVTLPECPDGALPGEMSVDYCVDSSSVRATDARRLSLKAHMKVRVFSDMRVCAEETYTDENLQKLSGADMISIERLTAKHKTARSSYGSYSSGISGTVRTSGEIKPIGADGKINIVDASPAGGKVKVRAEAIVCVLCMGDDGLYTTIRSKEAIEDEIDIPTAAVGDMARAWGRVASVTVTATDEGLSFDVEYDINAECMKEEEASLCEDIFSTSCETETVMNEREFYAPVKCAVFHLTQEGSVKRHSTPSAGEYITCITANATPEKASYSDGKLTLSGTVNVRMGIAQEGDVSPEEGKIPFAISISADEIQTPVWCADVVVTDTTGRIEGSTVAVNAELCISMKVLEKKKARCVESVRLNKSKEVSQPCGMKIYFPEEGEGLWNIAKHYKVSCRSLMKINGIPEGTKCTGTSPIMICR